MAMRALDGAELRARLAEQSGGQRARLTTPAPACLGRAAGLAHYAGPRPPCLCAALGAAQLGAWTNNAFAETPGPVAAAFDCNPWALLLQDGVRSRRPWGRRADKSGLSRMPVLRPPTLARRQSARVRVADFPGAPSKTAFHYRYGWLSKCCGSAHLTAPLCPSTLY